MTPLHVAAQLGHEAIASLLLDHGAALLFDATSVCKVGASCLLLSHQGVLALLPFPFMLDEIFGPAAAAAASTGHAAEHDRS